MAKTITGIDIGTGEIKLVTCAGGEILSTASLELPENMVKDGLIASPEAMGQHLRTLRREHKLRGGPCSLSLPGGAASFRRLTMPIMNEAQLTINLPYEFTNFINTERGDYCYDYALLNTIHDEEGNPSELDMLAAAAPQSLLTTYRDMLRRAGFTLKKAVPEVYAYVCLIHRQEQTQNAPPDREYAFLDLGQGNMRLHFFQGRGYENSRVMETGARDLDVAIANELYIDEHLAHTYRLTNHNNVLDLPCCQEIYAAAAMDILRALNFHRYNNPGTTLDALYLAGSGASIPQMEATLRESLSLEVRHVGELMPACDEADRFAVAYGMCLD